MSVSSNVFQRRTPYFTIISMLLDYLYFVHYETSYTRINKEDKLAFDFNRRTDKIVHSYLLPLIRRPQPLSFKFYAN